MPFKNIEKRREYSKKHYQEHKQKYIKSNNARRKLLKNYINNLKNNSPCTDCKRSYPYFVMDFDQLSDKNGLIISFIRNNNKSGLINELSKCEIVCSNCHRIRTYKRLSVETNQ